MAVKVKRLLRIMEELAPARLASEWDNVGLQTGHPESNVDRILLTLDINGAVAEEAVQREAQAVISHHPLIFKPLKTLRSDNPIGAVLSALVNRDIALMAAHTNLDSAAGGVSDALAELLGLLEPRVLQRTEAESLFKLVVFIPADSLDVVREAVSAAGAGHIGRYSHCSFISRGTGTFKPLEGAQPYIGEIGNLEEADEYRLETVVPSSVLDRVIAAMLKAHPYEEVAYDVYKLRQSGAESGFGRYGQLPQEKRLDELAGEIRRLLGTEYLRIVGDPERIIKKVAVCGGSGGGLIERAVDRQADLLLTGDIKYHEAQQAETMGLALIDAGHAATERPVVFKLRDDLQQRLAGEVEIIISSVATDPVRLFH
ncbi:MAG: Nif3-like dinuclear metal center hexameric protein [bacterium]|nr:Nif3-like dinuclear metal center hexameric protein [bacterium]